MNEPRKIRNPNETETAAQQLTRKKRVPISTTIYKINLFNITYFFSSRIEEEHEQQEMGHPLGWGKL